MLRHSHIDHSSSKWLERVSGQEPMLELDIPLVVLSDILNLKEVPIMIAT